MASEKSDLASELSERGIGFQAWGFAVVGFSSVVVLQFYSGSDSWLYKSFQTAVTQLHWAFLVPLAALFDWGRTMFETRKAIREAAIKSQIEEAVEKVLESERQRIRERLAKSDLPRDVQEQVLQELS